MLRYVLLGLGLLSCGCAGPAGGVVLYGPTGTHEGAGGPAPNLALGPSADHLWVACELTQRSAWPSVDVGYRFDDFSYYSEVQFDNQHYYDRYGAYYRAAESVRTGVLVR